MKQFINYKLFKDGFKQVKTLGFIFLILLTFFYVIIPIGDYISLQEALKEELFDADFIPIIHYDTMDFATFLMFPLYVGSFLFPINLFSFLHKRNASDFYHSIPHKRVTLYISYTLSLCAWFAVIIFVPCLIVILITKIFSSVFTLSAASLLISALNVFVGCLLIIAGTSIGCFLTGTTLNNVIFSLIIVFMPRILIFAFSSLISSTAIIVNNFNNIFILRDDINIVTGIMSYDEILLNNIGIHTLYSFLLAIIYFILAGFIYIKRNSESAGNATINKKIEYAILIFIGFIVSLPTILILFEYITSFDKDKSLSSSFTFGLIITIFGIAATLFIYQFITTRKAKAAVKSMLLTPFVIITDSIILGFLVLFFNLALNFEPDVKDVDYVKLDLSYNSDYHLEYFIKQLQDEKITDTQIIEKICDELSKNISEIKNGDHNIYRYDYELPIEINCDGTSYYRTIFINEDIYTDIYEDIISSCNAYDIFTNLPELDGSNAYLAPYQELDISNTAVLEDIYNVLREEIKENPTPFIEHVLNDYMNNCILIKYIKNNHIYEFAIPVIPEYTKSYKIYVNDIINELNMDNTIGKNLINNLDQHIKECTDIYISVSSDSPTGDVRLLKIEHKIYTTNKLIDYINDPSSFNNADYLSLLKDTGYLAQYEKNALKELTSYIGVEYNGNSVSYLFWIDVDMNNDSTGKYSSIHIPVIIPEEKFDSIFK